MIRKIKRVQDTTAEILELRGLRESVSKDTDELRQVEQAMTPVWGRLAQRRVDNSFGLEYDLSMIPRGATS